MPWAYRIIHARRDSTVNPALNFIMPPVLSFHVSAFRTIPPPPPPRPTPPPPIPPAPQPPQPPPSSGSRSFDLETIENGVECHSVCYCKPAEFYVAQDGSGQTGWKHFVLNDATFSSEGCTCNYTVISGPSAGNTFSSKGRFGKLCGCHWK